MRTAFNKEKVKVLLLTAFAVTLLLALPRLVIIFYVKFNAENKDYDIRAGSFDFILRFTYTYIIAVIFLWVNTSRIRYRLAITPLSIDLNRFYHRLILNILLFIVLRVLTTQFNLHVPRIAVSEKFYEFIFNITLILEIVLCILAAEIYMLVTHNQAIYLRNQALQKANAETSFEVLKNQVNPHFLFNSLNTIHAMIGKDDEAAKAFVSNMSGVYRHVLSSARKPVVTLAEEMDFLKAYINMLRERHGDNLNVKLEIDNEHMTDLLPPMSLQILVENAVKHNIVSAKQPLLIEIEVNDTFVSVCNVIREKKTKPPSTGTGLYNLSQRYWFLCKKEITISQVHNRFAVFLPLLKVAEIESNSGINNP